jgi:hypothetical protein
MGSYEEQKYAQNIFFSNLRPSGNKTEILLEIFHMSCLFLEGSHNVNLLCI